MNEWVLAERSHHDVRERRPEVVVLPFGATEPHNLHMPYGTDTFQVEALGRAACAHAHHRDARVLLLPVIPYGVNTNYFHIEGGLTCSLTPTTLLAVLADLVDSMERQGVRKMVLLNGHGGNEFKPLLRQLHHRTGVFLCLCDWYRMAADLYPQIFDAPGEHADEVETSLGLALFPELVKPERADAGTTRPTRFEAINRGWVSITRPWHLATTSTGMGDPSAATADKGRRLVEALAVRLGDFLAELADADVNERFPY